MGRRSAQVLELARQPRKSRRFIETDDLHGFFPGLMPSDDAHRRFWNAKSFGDAFDDGLVRFVVGGGGTDVDSNSAFARLDLLPACARSHFDKDRAVRQRGLPRLGEGSRVQGSPSVL